MNRLKDIFVSGVLGGLAGAGLAATSFVAIEVLMPQSSTASEPKKINCVTPSSSRYSHEVGYRDGKSLAEIINAVTVLGIGKLDGETLKTIFMKKRSGYADVGMLSLQDNKSWPTEAVYCYMTKWEPLQKQAWSSVHAGLTDYLTPNLKAHFLSIPER